jgi:hypothetical protein
MGEAPKHIHGQGFLSWPGDGPWFTLRNDLAQVWVEMDVFLICCLGINNYAGFEHKAIQPLGSRDNIIAKALFAKGTSWSRQETVIQFHFRDIGTNQIDCGIITHVSGRLLVKSNGVEPTGKVSKLRVNRCVVRPLYVPLVSPQEISTPKVDSSLRGRMQIWQVYNWEHREITRSQDGT